VSANDNVVYLADRARNKLIDSDLVCELVDLLDSALGVAEEMDDVLNNDSTERVVNGIGTLMDFVSEIDLLS